jgi:hypothetical protein
MRFRASDKVAQNCILPRVAQLAAAASVQGPADYKSAIQQIENLRYFVHSRPMRFALSPTCLKKTLAVND